MEHIFSKLKAKEIHKNKIFITDGIINPEQWNKSKTKILFILKEAYGEEKDLNSFIRDKRKATGRTFKPMGQWAYGIQSLLDKKYIQDFPSEQNDINYALLSSALINIKKSNGKKSSSKTNLKEYIDSDWEELYKQINIINPTIIICGNTFSLIKGELQPTKISDRIYKDNSNNVYIDFWHPANRASNKMNYYALCALYHKYINIS